MPGSPLSVRLGSMLLLTAAGIAGLIVHYFILTSAIAGGASAFVAIVAAKAILALVGGYLSVRALRMSLGSRVTLLVAFELVPILMPLLSDARAWILFVLPDLATGAVGVALARKVDKRLVPAR